MGTCGIKNDSANRRALRQILFRGVTKIFTILCSDVVKSFVISGRKKICKVAGSYEIVGVTSGGVDARVVFGVALMNSARYLKRNYIIRPAYVLSLHKARLVLR